MKIAIVTVYDSIVNYGSFLQAYALMETLEELGHDVYFVRRMSDEKILKRFDVLCEEQNKIPDTKKLRLIRQAIKNLRIKKERSLNRERYKAFQKDWKNFKIIEKEDLEKNGIELIICGSDEIWNLHNKDIDFEFYSCKWAESIPKLAYAISSGDTTEDEFLQVKYGMTAIGDFEIILPRDEETQKVVTNITGELRNQVCDPTILWGYEKYPITDYGKQFGKYMLVYSYYYTKKEKEFIIKYAKEHRLKIISPCIYSSFADINICVASMEFPSLIHNAECVVTTTFHGTIFSLMFAKRMCCMPRLPKVNNLLESCRAMEYALEKKMEYAQFEEIIEREVNRNRIHISLDELRNSSLIELEKAISDIKNQGRKPIGVKYTIKDKVYYGYSKDEVSVRKKSSSGGMFYEMANNILEQNGVVFGAAYDEKTKEIYHRSTEELPLECLMRSKYVESNLGNTFKEIERYLAGGRKVLFCGTPCQAAGLRQYASLKLKAFADDLFIVDFLCEGVPSSKVFKEYQAILEKKYFGKIYDINFRSKEYGWNRHCMKVCFENGKEYIRPSFADPYMHTFIMDLVLNRKSCYSCKYREHKMSDITIGDFWKVDKVDSACKDNKGVSAIFVHSENGKRILDSISGRINIEELDAEKLLYIKQNLKLDNYYEKRNEFYKVFCREGFSKAVEQYSTYINNTNVISKIKKIKIWIIWEMKRRMGKF